MVCVFFVCLWVSDIFGHRLGVSLSIKGMSVCLSVSECLRTCIYGNYNWLCLKSTDNAPLSIVNTDATKQPSAPPPLLFIFWEVLMGGRCLLIPLFPLYAAGTSLCLCCMCASVCLSVCVSAPDHNRTTSPYSAHFTSHYPIVFECGRWMKSDNEAEKEK